MDELSKLLAYLDRDGVSELVLGTGRPVTVRQKGAYVPVTAGEVTKAQLGRWLIGTAFEPLIPLVEGESEPAQIAVHGRRLKVQLTRQGQDLLVRVEPASGDDVKVADPRARRTTKRPTKSPTKRPATKPSVRSKTVAPPMAVDELDLASLQTFELAAPDKRGPAPTKPAAPPPPDAGIDIDLATLPPARFTAPSPPPSVEFDFDAAGGDFELADLQPSVARAVVSRAEPAWARTSGDLPEPPTRRGDGPDSISISIAELAVARPEPAAPSVGGIVDERPSAAAIQAISSVIRSARQRGASDLHVAPNRPTMIRAMGELVALDPRVLAAADVDGLLQPLLGEVSRALLASRGYVDFAIDSPEGGRLRGNISRQQGGLKGSFRLAFARPPTLDELNLPKDVAKVVSHHQGLVVIAGPSGHGKTTTLAALVDLINGTRAHHILTIEDPVEIEHPRKTAIVSQREVGRHTRSFAAALKASLREDPDVIVIGELRDRETVEIALTAAETGHLVIATMSTPSAAKTIDRLIDMFPPDDQSQVRASLAGALRAIVAQRLLPRADGSGVVPAIEVLTGVLPLAALIRDNRLFQLPNLMQRGRSFGMVRLDDSLLELVRSGAITEEVALRAADNRKELLAVLNPPAPLAIPSVKKGLGSMFRKDDR